MDRDAEHIEIANASDAAHDVCGVTLTPLLLNRDQLGAILGGISPRQISSLVSCGLLPRPIKIGRLARWRRVDIEAWVRTLPSTGIDR